jgi:hypothetical protein
MHNSTRAAFKSRFEEGAGVVRVSGPVTLHTLRELRTEVLRGAMTTDAVRVLCDLSAAVILLDRHEWVVFSREAGSRHAVGVPLGYLVGAEAAEPVRKHCDRMTARGRICLAFMSSLAAYRWLGVAALAARRSPAEAVQG